MQVFSKFTWYPSPVIHVQNLSNCCRHNFNQSILRSFLNLIFGGGFFSIQPNCASASMLLRQTVSGISRLFVKDLMWFHEFFSSKFLAYSLDIRFRSGFLHALHFQCQTAAGICLTCQFDIFLNLIFFSIQPNCASASMLLRQTVSGISRLL